MEVTTPIMQKKIIIPNAPKQDIKVIRPNTSESEPRTPVIQKKQNKIPNAPKYIKTKKLNNEELEKIKCTIKSLAFEPSFLE